MTTGKRPPCSVRADRVRGDIKAPVPAIEQPDREATIAAVKEALGSAYRAANLAGLMGE